MGSFGKFRVRKGRAGNLLRMEARYTTYYCTLNLCSWRYQYLLMVGTQHYGNIMSGTYIHYRRSKLAYADAQVVLTICT